MAAVTGGAAPRLASPWEALLSYPPRRVLFVVGATLFVNARAAAAASPAHRERGGRTATRNTCGGALAVAAATAEEGTS